MKSILLSILIPTRDFAPRRLVESLAEQAGTLTGTEILVLDDASGDTQAKADLHRMEADGLCRVLWQAENQGRARARNILYKESRGSILLFIDSDAEVTTSDFLARHLADAQEADVVCGGLTNPAPPASKGCELRYKYEAAAARKGFRSAVRRMEHPYDRISTFNLLVHRHVMQTFPFDENLTEYGYEDVAFGLTLQQHGFRVLHTDNALLHTGINPNSIFLANTEAAIRSLSLLPDDIKRNIPLSRLARRLHSLHLAVPVRLIFRFMHPLLRRNLLGHHPLLPFFQFYKLGTLLTCKSCTE